MSRTPSTPRAGSSLLEVLIATTVLTVASAGTLRATLSAHRLQGQALERDLACSVLSSRLEEVLEENVEDLIGGDPQYVEGALLPLDRELFENQELRFRTPGYVAGSPAPDSLWVELELTWDSQFGGRNTTRMTGARRADAP